MNAELESCLLCYRTAQIIVGRARDRVLGNPRGSYVGELECPDVGRRRDEAKRSLEDYFDRLWTAIEEGAWIELVASFERIAFQWFGNATGDLRCLVRREYSRAKPFHIVVEGLVKDENDVKNLGGINSLLRQGLDETARERLREIIDHRNYIAHGRRLGRPSQMNLREAAQLLDGLLGVIRQS